MQIPTLSRGRAMNTAVRPKKTNYTQWSRPPGGCEMSAVSLLAVDLSLCLPYSDTAPKKCSSHTKTTPDPLPDLENPESIR